MPTYTYETLSPTPRRFEVRQSFSDAPLENDPETGEPVRRVISGGQALLTQKESAKVGQPPAGGCGSSCGCGH
jgi:predicted nucleic acid-binding Zn ribbon protein